MNSTDTTITKPCFRTTRAEATAGVISESDNTTSVIAQEGRGFVFDGVAPRFQALLVRLGLSQASLNDRSAK